MLVGKFITIYSTAVIDTSKIVNLSITSVQRFTPADIADPDEIAHAMTSYNLYHCLFS